MNLINFFGAGINSIFGNSKDNYTQTKFNTLSYFHNLHRKSEIYVDTSLGNLHKLYLTTPELFAVIDRRANMLSNGRWIHKKNDKVIENSDIVRKLENPNPLMNGNEFIRNISIAKDVYGNAFVNGIKPIGLPDKEIMYVLPSKYMKIKTTGNIYKQVKKDKIIESYVLDYESAGTIKETYKPNEILHIKDVNPDDPILGQSKIVSLMLPISNIRGAYGFRNRLINSDGAIGIMSGATDTGMGVGLSDDEQKRLNAGYRSTYGMQTGKSDILMTEANVKWNPISYPTKDMMLFEEISADFRIIIDTYGLNDNIFSREKASTFDNLDKGIRMAYQDCIIPESEQISLEISKFLGLNGKDEYVYLDYSHLEILKENESVKSEVAKRNAETYAILVQNGRVDLANELYAK
jgi:HK97 family phage portal protein